MHIFEERIDKLEKDLRAKADNGDFDGEKGEPGDKGDPGKDATNNDPNAVHVSGNQAISGVKNFIDTPTINGNKVLDDSLQIGGRNLLPNSSFESSFGGGWSYTDMSNLFQKDGFIYIKKPNVTNSRTFLTYYVTDMSEYDEGEEYTFSIDFHTSVLDADGGSTSSFVRMLNANGSTIKDELMFNIDPDKCRNGYTRFSGTGVIQKGTTKLQVTLAISDSIIGNFWVRHAKLEKGNKATDWTPAPEDIGTSQPIMSGNYGLRVTADGFQKTTDGGATWTTADI